MEDDIVEPDWKRWRAAAALWLPLLTAVALINAFVLWSMPHSTGPPYPSDMEQRLAWAILLLKVQTVANAIPFFLFGVHAAAVARKILETELYPPQGVNVLFRTRRRRGRSVRGLAFMHLLAAAIMFFRVGAELWLILRL